jgi:hypothetical protein
VPGGAYGSFKVSASTAFSAASDFESATGSLPSLSVSGHDAPFLEAKLDLASFVASLEGIPLSASIPGFSYDLFSAELTASVELAQSLTFTPSKVDVTLSVNGQTKTGHLGDSFSFTAPASGTGTMQVTASYTLEDSVETKTSIQGTLGLTAEGLDATVLFSPIGPLIGPYNISISKDLFDFPAEDFSVPLPAQTDTYSISYGSTIRELASGAPPVTPAPTSTTESISPMVPVFDLTEIGFGANTTLCYAANGDNSAGALTVADGTNTFNLALLGQYAAAGFTTAPDQGGGTVVIYKPVQDGSGDLTLLTNLQH